MPELVDGTSSSTEPAKGVVLVALPSLTDSVHGIGPEEKHVTLVYMGKTDELPMTDQGVLWYDFAAVKDAVTKWLNDPSAGGEFSTFSAPIKENGITSLGDEGARVWMFDSPRLVGLHDALLTVKAVGDLAGKVDQFPSYIPHTTIGYPTEGRTTLDPATEAAAGAVGNVSFDRLALWWGDNRVEWPLLSRGGSMTKEAELIQGALDLIEKRVRATRVPVKSIAQSESIIDKVLKHAGILGMKWGVRRKPGPDGTVSSAAAKASASDDAARAKATLKTLKKSGVKALSNDDLQHLTKRLQLEKKLTEVDTRATKIDRKVQRLLGYGETMNRAILFANSNAGKELNLLLRNKSRGRHALPPLERLIPKAPTV